MAQKKNEIMVRSGRSRNLLLLLLCAFGFALLASPPPIRFAMADSSSATVQIVYTVSPHGEDPEAYHIRTLSAVLGSEEAAKSALVYSYKSTVNGFSAKLTPQQVAQISKQPGVLQVVPSMTYQLHSGPDLNY